MNFIKRTIRSTRKNSKIDVKLVVGNKTEKFGSIKK